MERYNLILKNQIFQEKMEKLAVLEEDRIFCRHDYTHLLDVCRIAYILCLEKGMGISKDLIYAAGLLHDLGRVDEYEEGIGHHLAGAGVAEEILKQCRYTQDETVMVCDAIRNHRSETRESTVKDEADGETLGHLLYMADKKSRNCFCCKAYNRCKWNEERKNKGVT